MDNIYQLHHQRDRRTGRTTREIDRMVQHLFLNGFVELTDHADMPNNLSFECMKNTFLDRLHREHRIKRNNGYTYDPENRIVRLMK